MTQIIDEIFRRFGERGAQSYGEGVTELQHALQCAMFASRAAEPREIVAACLLHDYGHLLHDLGEDIAERGLDAQHEELGAKHLAQWFPAEIVEPIRLHVQAKRYLCLRRTAYFKGLSDASRLSLQLQGGVMTEREALDFETNPYSNAAIRVRLYDDAGKVPDLATPGLESFRELLESLIRP